MEKNLFATKTLESILAESEEPQHSLKRALTAKDLTALGIGAIIGAGIFATTGTAAAGDAVRLGAGPAIMVSYILVALACGFCALCYAEFASMIPIAGSAYTYSYATLGELIAWIIGWDLILEYAVGNVAVAISWSEYLASFLNNIGVQLPAWLMTTTQTIYHSIDASLLPGASPEVIQRAADMKAILASAPTIGGIHLVFNLPAVLIIALITYVLVIGIRESSFVNNLMVLLKLLIIGFFIVVGIYYINPKNWVPFSPNGWPGIHAGAAIIFFAYIGFDAVSTAAEETKDPGRNLPLGILGSLVVCTIVYVAVAAVLTGMLSYKELGVGDPMAKAFESLGIGWAAAIISFGAVVAMTAVLLVFQLGQPRIFFSMSRDGLLPAWFSKVHPVYKTPHASTILTGFAVALCAAFFDINVVIDLCNIGTLFAFVLVCAGIIVLRHTKPDAVRPFRVPWVPVIPILGIASCVYLMTGLPTVTWIRFGVWLLVGLVFYFLWGFRHSVLRNKGRE